MESGAPHSILTFLFHLHVCSDPLLTSTGRPSPSPRLFNLPLLVRFLFSISQINISYLRLPCLLVVFLFNVHGHGQHHVIAEHAAARLRQPIVVQFTIVPPLPSNHFRPHFFGLVRMLEYGVDVALPLFGRCVGPVEDRPEHAAIDGGLVQDERILLVIPRIAHNGHNQIVASGELSKSEIGHGAGADEGFLGITQHVGERVHSFQKICRETTWGEGKKISRARESRFRGSFGLRKEEAVVWLLRSYIWLYNCLRNKRSPQRQLRPQHKDEALVVAVVSRGWGSNRGGCPTAKTSGPYAWCGGVLRNEQYADVVKFAARLASASSYIQQAASMAHETSAAFRVCSGGMVYRRGAQDMIVDLKALVLQRKDVSGIMKCTPIDSWHDTHEKTRRHV